MVQGLEKEVKNVRYCLKQKELDLDLIRSEKDDIRKELKEMEKTRASEHRAFLNEFTELRKTNIEQGEKIQVLMQQVNMAEERERETERETNEIRGKLSHVEQQLRDSEGKTKLYKKYIEEQQQKLENCQLRLQSQVQTPQESVVKELKEELQQALEQLQETKQQVEYGELLRSRLVEDFKILTQQKSQVQVYLIEARSQLREEKEIRESLESRQTELISEVSTARGRECLLTKTIEENKSSLAEERERNKRLLVEVAEEQRLKIKEQNTVSFLRGKLKETKQWWTVTQEENCRLQKEKDLLNSEISSLKTKISQMEQETSELRQKVQEMRLAVEEYQSNSQTANHVQGQRWRHLLQITDNIQLLGHSAVRDYHD
ncbi:uncharacterized protein LOC143253547 [Tachypleus tridentatus]|uniref:uncharacterized protein LOC143253547 n=1 Tax=Tachypleus tridentatus TaxID=6853 RepID=UPI003FCFC0AD